MKKVIGYITAFLAGATAALFLVIKSVKPSIQYNYKIGKVKTKGNGNKLKVSFKKTDESAILPTKNKKIFSKWRERRNSKKL